MMLPENLVRIPYGVVNEVYTNSEHSAVWKVAGPPTPGSYRSLAREAAACRLLAPALPGIVPQVLDEQLPHLLVLSFLAGQPLSVAGIPPSLPQRHTVLDRLGTILAIINSISADNLPDVLRWPFQGNSWSQKALAAFVAVSRQVSTSSPELAPLMHQCRGLLEHSLSWLDHSHQGFIHGDFSGSNILLDPCTWVVTGVIDWEWATIADADYDLMRLHWRVVAGRGPHLWSTPAELTTFNQGYQRHRQLPIEAEKLRWYGLFFATSYLALRLQRNMLAESNDLVNFIRHQVSRW